MARVTWSLPPVGEAACLASAGRCRVLALLGLCQMPLWDTTCVRGVHWSLPGYAVFSIVAVAGW